MDVEGLHFIDMETGQQTVMLANPDYTAIEYSSSDTYLIACGKFNPQAPSKNLHLINAQTGAIEAEWEWRKTPKDGTASLKFMHDESYCLRLVSQAQNAKEPNSIEVYTDGNFSAPKMVISARFPVKPAKKSDPITFVNGRFDGLDLCPLNPAVPANNSPFYMLAW